MKYTMLFVSLLLSAQPVSLAAEQAETQYKTWDLQRDTSIKAVQWPTNIHGDKFVIKGNIDAMIMLQQKRVINPTASRIEVSRGDTNRVKGINIFYVWMTKDEVIQEVGYLVRQFNIKKNGAESFEKWKNNPDDVAVVMGGEIESPTAFIEIQHSYNKQKPWYIILRLDFPAAPLNSSDSLKEKSSPAHNSTNK
jgi:hypothetical protein